MFAAETEFASYAGWAVAVIGPVVVWWFTARPGQKVEAQQAAAEFVVDASFKIANDRMEAEHDCQQQLAAEKAERRAAESEMREQLDEHAAAIRECQDDRRMILEVARQAGVDTDGLPGT